MLLEYVFRQQMYSFMGFLYEFGYVIHILVDKHNTARVRVRVRETYLSRSKYLGALTFVRCDLDGEGGGEMGKKVHEMGKKWKHVQTVGADMRC